LIDVLDSTLREGEQTPGVYFDKHIKLAVAKLLDKIGIKIIETGHPAVTAEIYEAVYTIAHSNLKSIIGAHSRSHQKDVDTALECHVDFLGIFYCVSDERLDSVFKKDLSTAIDQITRIVDYVKRKKPDMLVRYTPEDTVRTQFENVVEAASAAVEAGADIISVADTTGYMVPGTKRSMYDYIARLKDSLSRRNQDPRIAVHCHNDRGFALANALDSVRAGAEIVDASVLGLGERAGIVDLGQLLVNLAEEYGMDRWNLDLLPDLYEFVSEHAGVPIPVNHPVTGKNAFTHCAGVHTHAAAINPMHYESLSPEIIGRERGFSLDHMSGIASLRYALKLLGIEELESDTLAFVIDDIKRVGQRGKTVSLEELRHIIDFYAHLGTDEN